MKYLVGILLLIVAIINARRILRWIGEGEAYLVVSAGGDGLFGRAVRLDQPAAFWFNIAANGLIVIAAALFGIGILVGLVDF